MKIKNSQGFSLAEILAVVAILAILATISYPSYQAYIARARQKEGFNLLNEYYLGAQSARAQFGFFPGNLVATGFQPSHQLGYRLQANNNAGNAPNINFNDPGCTDTANATPCTCAGNCGTYKTWSEPPVLGAAALRLGPVVVPGGGACPGLQTVDDNFVVKVAGVVTVKAATADVYSINERKVMTMCFEGTK